MTTERPRNDPGTPARSLMLADPRRALTLAGILLGAGILVCLVVWVTATRARVQWLDDRVFSLMERVRNPLATALAKALSFVGGTICNWTVRVLVIAVLIWRRHWVHLGAFAVAVVTSEVMLGTLKALYNRPRPVGGLVATTSSSFPSGHAVAAAVTAVGLVIALLPPGHKRWGWERRAVLYTSLMALSRVYLGVHWFSDVVAGALLGGALALGWPAVFELMRARLLRTEGSPERSP